MPKFTKHCLLMIFLVLPPNSSVFSGDKSQKEPELAAIVRAGRETRARLQKQPASWTAVTRLPNDSRVVVEILATPTMRRTVVSIHAKEKKLGETLIIARDGFWYVYEAGKRGKFRPFEAPLVLNAAYLFLLRAEPRFVPEDSTDHIGVFEGSQDGVATYRTPLSDTIRRQLQYSIDGLEKLQRQDPGAYPDSVKAIERMRGMLAGIPVRIDSSNGLLVQYGTPDRQTEFQKFDWLDQIATEEFAVDGHQWDDFTDDPTLGDSADLLMISHNASWQPGLKSSDSDACLMDVRTGKFRRILFQGISALPGCFLKDRRRVVVTGLDDVSGRMVPYEIDLKTGINRQLGGDQLASGNSLMPALSPDGKTIAVLHKKPEGRPLDSQIYLIDVESGNAKPLGSPHDMAFLSWLPDANGLVLLKRETTDASNLNAPRTETIVRMGLNGQTTRLLDGGMPVMLHDGKSILFKGPGSKGWQTCDLNGENVQPFADGLARHVFPSPGPDGKRILWMYVAQGAAPVPTVIPIGKNSGKPITKVKGLWSLPSWR